MLLVLAASFALSPNTKFPMRVSPGASVEKMPVFRGYKTVSMPIVRSVAGNGMAEGVIQFDRKNWIEPRPDFTYTPRK